MPPTENINFEQLAWPSTDLDDVLAKIKASRDDPTDYLCANLHFVSSAARRGLVMLLAKLGDRRALVPLMRYVFDTREKVLEQDARAAAMQTIIAIADAQNEASGDRKRVVSFLMDMLDEPDGFVRAHIMRGLGRLGSRRAFAPLKAAWNDEHEFVAEQARVAHRELSDRAHLLAELEDVRPHKELDDGVLVDRVGFVNSADLKPFLYELSMRPNALELANRVLSLGTKRNHYVLEILAALNDPAAREVVVQHLRVASSETDVAASFRVLARYLDEDANKPECESIEKGLQSTSPHIKRAAIRAAGVAGSDRLLESVRAAMASKDPNIAQAATKAIEAAADTGNNR